MKKIGLALLMLVVLGLALAAVAVNRVLQDPTLLEDYLSQALEREISIGQLHELKLGLESTLLVDNLAIANPEWAQEPYFLQLTRARVHLDLPSLWGDGPVVINNLELEGLRLGLLESDEHRPNWQIGDPAADYDDPGRDSLALPVLLKQAHVSDSAITYRATDADLAASLEGQLVGGGGLDLEVNGRWQDQPVQFQGKTLYEDDVLKLSGEGDFRQWQLATQGSLADPLAFRGLDFQLDIRGQLPMPAVESQDARHIPLQLNVHLSGSGRKLQLSRGLLVSGDSHLTINGALGNLANLSGLDLDVVFDSSDIKPLLPVDAINAQPVQLALEARLLGDGEKIKLQKIAGRSGGVRLQGDLTVPVAGGLKGTRISLYAHGDSVEELLAPWVEIIPEDAPFELDVKGQWQEPVWQLEPLKLQLGQNQLHAALAVTPEDTGVAMSGNVRLSGKRAYRVLSRLGLSTQVPDDSYLLKTELLRTAEGAIRLRDFDFQLGGSDLAGQFFYQPGQPARVDAQLTAKTLDMRFLSKAFDSEMEQAEPAASGRTLDSNTPLTRAQLEERMIPDTPLDVSWLSDYEGKVSLEIEELIARDDLRSQGEFGFTLEEGKLTSDRMQWSGNFSSGEATLVLEQAGQGADVNLELQSHRLPLFWLLTGDPHAEQQSDYRVTMRGRGATIRELAANLDGSIYLRGGGGKMNNQGLNLFFGDVFGEVFSRINPMSQQEDFTQLECHSGGVVIVEGLASLDPGMVMRTDKIDVALGGTVNLETEGLNLVFNTRSRTGVGISASKALTPYLKLGGNFSNPRMGVNTKGVVVSGGAAVATGGLSILAEGMWDRWIATASNPCEALFDKGKEAEGELKKLFGRPL